MARHPRKKQRTDKSTRGAAPLGAAVSLDDDASKDDEERRLESALFGVPYVPSWKGKQKETIVPDEDEAHDQPEVEAAGRELEGMLDSDLFFVDDAVPSTSKGPSVADFADDFGNNLPGDEISEKGQQDDSGEPQHAFSPDNSDTESENGQDESTSSGSDSEPDRNPLNRPSSPAARPTWATTSTSPSHPDAKTKSKKKAPAWTDPADASLTVSLAAPRLRKLRDAPGDDSVSGREYERRLRRQHERIHGTASWADKARKKLRGTAKRRRGSDSEGDSALEEDEKEQEDGGLDDLLASTGGLLSRKKTRTIAPGTLSIERLRDANVSAKAEGAIKSVQFHPSPRVPVMLTASADRRLRLFNIDGHTNPHLSTIHIPALPLSSATFHPSGSSILLTGSRPFFYVHDLQSGATTKSARGLWGTSFTSSTSTSTAELTIGDNCAFSRDGSVLAIPGRRGAVHLLDWAAGAGSGQVVASIKATADRGARSLLWDARREGTLHVLGEDGEMYMWDVRGRRCMRRWRDEGAYGGRVLAGDARGRYTAIGSATGYVNVYSNDETDPSTDVVARPKSLKAIGNLTTAVSALRFNHDAQLLAIASSVKKDQMRLIHLPSLTAFSNWPTSGTPLGHVNAVDFSAGSEYVAIGNSRGRVLLYHLRDFGLS